MLDFGLNSSGETSMPQNPSDRDMLIVAVIPEIAITLELVSSTPTLASSNGPK
jgi:hypothetical protein